MCTTHWLQHSCTRSQYVWKHEKLTHCEIPYSRKCGNQNTELIEQRHSTRKQIEICKSGDQCGYHEPVRVHVFDLRLIDRFPECVGATVCRKAVKDDLAFRGTLRAFLPYILYFLTTPELLQYPHCRYYVNIQIVSRTSCLRNWRFEPVFPCREHRMTKRFHYSLLLFTQFIHMLPVTSWMYVYCISPFFTALNAYILHVSWL